MTDKTLTITDNLTMTSKEIAELTGKQHGHVIRDLKDLDIQGVIDLSKFGEISKDSMNRDQTIYRLPRREVLILTSGYSAKQRAAIIDRWLYLEQQAIKSPPMLPIQAAVAEAQAILDFADQFGVPKHYALIESTKLVNSKTGIDLQPLLAGSVFMNNIPYIDEMLEPTELGRRFGMSGRDMNRALASMGLQKRIGGEWVATEEGAKISQRHAWSSGSKSGYNIKWLVSDVEDRLKAHGSTGEDKPNA